MLISIITPVYNGEKYIKETMESIHSQSFKNFEHIVMDGGSTDSTLEIVKQYPKAIVISEKDKGQTDAINKGFKMAKGDILAWQNADDCYMPGTFQKINDYFENNIAVDLMYGSYQVIDADSNWKFDVFAKNWSLFKFSHGLFVPMQPSVFWRRSVYEKVGNLNINLVYCMDVDFFAQASKNFIIQSTKEFYGRFRVHSESKTHSPNVLFTVLKEKRKVLKANFNYNFIDDFLFFLFSSRSVVGGILKPLIFKRS